jgi:hypothetical protein
MRMRRSSALLLVGLLLPPSLIYTECIPFDQARQHVGEARCITGRVVRIEQGMKGVHYLDFCEDYRLCPFTAVIFSSDLKSVGDVRQLQGRVVEIHGPVKEYDGRAEIVLQEARQLGGAGASIPPLPKNYDVEKQGHFSAGKFSHPKARHKSRKKRQPAKVPLEVPEDEEN